MTRREFIRIAGASLALAGVSGCVEPPRERILPYTVQPRDVVPGVARHYATTMTLHGYGTGVLIESREGRPTKVEGNPEHPASLGAAGVYEQASILQLYDPYRAKSPRQQKRPASWLTFGRAFGPAPNDTGSDEFGRGERLRFLLEPTASPLTGELLDRIRERYPQSRAHFYAPLAAHARLEGTRLAFGRTLETQYDVSAADVILSLDCDFLGSGPSHLRYAREYADRRRSPADGMNRLYVVEAALSDTGGIADHRLRACASDVGAVAAAILGELARGLAQVAPDTLRTALERVSIDGDTARWARAAAADLAARRGASLVIAGDHQPPEVHAIACAMNALLDNAGRTVWYTQPAMRGLGESAAGIEPLVAELRAGQVHTLVILGGNPVYNTPAGLEFAEVMRAVPRAVYVGLYENETARLATWFVPESHYLESWGDARARDGTASLVQPLIAPLYEGRSVDEILAVFLGEAERGAHDLLRESWQRRRKSADFDAFWNDALARGMIDGTRSSPEPVAMQWNALATPLGVVASSPGATDRGSIEVVFRPDAKLFDGRFADNPWLQELPDPATSLTWGNAALVSPRTAEKLGVRDGDVLSFGAGEREITIPALVSPWHADDSISLHFGYGRTGAEAVARGVGSNVYALWSTAQSYTSTDVHVTRAARARNARLATTRRHWSMEGRPIALHATLADYVAAPDFTRSQRGRTLSLYRPHPYSGEQWAMTIDLGVCTGCSACVVACQAENNTPVVGPGGVLNGREMQWLRIDRYATGDPADPGSITQPMLCQHCEKAPCEYVCPVNATVHSADGLNEMVYNRCVGTRFCSNNCPYKVRRFNWFDYGGRSETEQMQLNPDVTVRARGVMEKCTYCVQRIRRAQIEAQIEGRPLRDGDVLTACQQSCPTRAIVFGSLGDAESEVSRSRSQPRVYSVLHELGTVPRTQYLARITNPNPALTEG